MEIEGNNYILKALNQVIENFKINSLKRELSIAERYLQVDKNLDNHFEVLVAGQFKAGKSSFINNLIGRDVLPVGVLPVTAIITRIQFASEDNVLVKFLDGSTLKIKIAEVENYISENYNPKNIKKVKLVDIFIPEMRDFARIRFTDTPGIGSFFEHNTETTFQWLPETGLALLVISVERPLSDLDVQIMRELSKYTSDINIVLTKVDLISPAQLEEISSFILKSISNQKIFPFLLHNRFLNPYSLIDKNSNYRNQIIKNVFVPLAENFSERIKNIYDHKIKSIVDASISYLNVGLQASERSEAEREILKNKIIDEHLKLQIVKQELEIITASYKNMNRAIVADVVMRYEDDLAKKLEDEYLNEFEQWKGNLYKISRNFESWIEKRLSELLLEYSIKAISELDNHTRKIENHFVLFAASFADRLRNNVKQIIGIELNTMTFNMKIEQIKQPDISVSYSFDIHIDLLWFLFPMFLFKRIFKNFFHKKILYEVQKNLNRLTSDITENINLMTERNRQSVVQYIASELQTIENVIDNQKNESINYETILNELKNLRDSIKN